MAPCGLDWFPGRRKYSVAAKHSMGARHSFGSFLTPRIRERASLEDCLSDRVSHANVSSNDDDLIERRQTELLLDKS